MPGRVDGEGSEVWSGNGERGRVDEGESGGRRRNKAVDRAGGWSTVLSPKLFNVICLCS